MPTPAFDNFGAPNEGRPWGVEVTFCTFRKGDSGLGREGRDFGRKAGLGARPGPIDWLSLETEGVGGVCVLFGARPPRLKAASEGFVGVCGNVSVVMVGEVRL